MEAPPLSEDELNMIYNWVDEIPLTRPKRNISRDFADGVLVAEIVHHFVPHIIELHNYSSANSVDKKKYNWQTLNKKVFKKIGFQVSQADIDAVVNALPEAIERILKLLRDYLEGYGVQKGPERQNSGYQQQNSENRYGGGNLSKSGAVLQPTQQLQQVGTKNVTQELLWEKDNTINELRETIDILEIKIKKLEDLVRLKDNKIITMQKKMQEHGLI